jgi:hypothetical protein
MIPEKGRLERKSLDGLVLLTAPAWAAGNFTVPIIGVISGSGDYSNGMQSGLPIKILGLLLLAATGAHGQGQCVLELASQSDGATSGFTLSLSAAADSSGNCQLSSLMLGLKVGDGRSLHTVQAPFSWQTGVVYTATAVLTSAGPQQLAINGQSAGSVVGAFTQASETRDCFGDRRKRHRMGHGGPDRHAQMRPRKQSSRGEHCDAPVTPIAGHGASLDFGPAERRYLSYRRTGAGLVGAGERNQLVGCEPDLE